MAQRILLLAVMWLMTAAAAFAAEPVLQLATFRADVTPPIGDGPCVGFMPKVASVEHPLEVRGIVLRANGETFVIAALDYQGLCNSSDDEFRRRMAEAAGTTPARRTQCKNNLKQIGLAMHNYHDVFGMFPPGFISKTPPTASANSVERSMYSWGAYILPYIDRAPLFAQLQVGEVLLEQNLVNGNLRALQTPMPAFRCASDVGPSVNNFDDSKSDNAGLNADQYESFVTSNGTDRIAIATSNYVMVANSSDSTTPPVYAAQYGPALGMGFINSNVKMRDITDGSSNTLLVGERAWRFNDLTIGAANVIGFSSEVNLAGSNMRTAALCALGIGYDGINYSATNRVHQRRGFNSNHVGGCHFVMSDGSVRFISQNIDYSKLSVTVAPYPAGFVTTTFARLLTRNDGQTVGEF